MQTQLIQFALTISSQYNIPVNDALLLVANIVSIINQPDQSQISDCQQS